MAAKQARTQRVVSIRVSFREHPPPHRHHGNDRNSAEIPSWVKATSCTTLRSKFSNAHSKTPTGCVGDKTKQLSGSGGATARTARMAVVILQLSSV